MLLLQTGSHIARARVAAAQAGVDIPHVLLQVEVAAEALGAHATLIGLEVGVRVHVELEVVDLVEGLAAHAATGGGIEVPLNRGPRHAGVVRQVDRDDVVAVLRNGREVVRLPHEPFGEQKAGREFTVVPRRPHRNREAPRPARGPIGGVEPDLQRLLQGNAIERVARCAAVETGDRNLAAL